MQQRFVQVLKLNIPYEMRRAGAHGAPRGGSMVAHQHCKESAVTVAVTGVCVTVMADCERLLTRSAFISAHFRPPSIALVPRYDALG